MAIVAHVSATASERSSAEKTPGNEAHASSFLVNCTVVAKPLSWQDSESSAVFDEEGPLTSEAVGAGYHYLAEAVDMPLAQAKAESQLEFQKRVQESVFGANLPFLSEIEEALKAIISRAEGGTVVSGQGAEMTKERVLFLEKDVRDIAGRALALICENRVARPEPDISGGSLS